MKLKSLFGAFLALALVAGGASAADKTDSAKYMTTLKAANGGQMAPIRVRPNAACDSSTPDVIIHDDGVAEDGYGWNPVANVGRLADKFTPVVYPATVDTACFAFITNAGVTSFNFDIVVYDEDGSGGAPGTELGRLSTVGHPDSVAGVPATPAFEEFDLSAMGLTIASGSVYIAVEWDAAVEPAGVFMAADESPTTPLTGGYQGAGGDPWEEIAATRPDYRALFIRAVMPIAGPGAPSVSKSFAPGQIEAGETSTLTITLRNNSQPTAAVLASDFSDVLPAGLEIAAAPNATTDCDNAVLTADAGTDTITLDAGAEIPASDSCTIEVDVTGAADGTYVNTIPTGELDTQHGDNANDASATLIIGFVFPEPYPDVTFPSAIEPITNVTFAGIDNTTAATSSVALEDFTAIQGNVAPGGTFHISVEGNTSGDWTNKVNVFIDWNQNGVFDAGEEIQLGDLVNSTGTDGKTVEADILVPTDAVVGETRMRVMKKFNTYATPNNNSGYGQAEDYTIAVAPATPAPTVAKVFAPTQVLTGEPSTLTITLDNSQNATDAELLADLTDTFPANLVVAAAPNAASDCIDATLTATSGDGFVTLAAGAKIPAGDSCEINVDVESAVEATYTNTIAAGALETDNGDSPFAASANLKVGYDFPEPYCPISFSTVEPISHVEFGDIDNPSDPNTGPAHEDFTAVIGNVVAGDTVHIAVQGNTSGPYTTVVTAYFDWTGDGDFDTAVAVGSLNSSTGTDGQKAETDVVVPTSAVTGATRMRITKNYNAATADACGSYSFGQAEDYTLMVAPPLPSVAKAFAPETVDEGEDSTLTITISNPLPGTATLTAPLVDNLPAGLEVTSATTSCGLVIGGSEPLPMGAPGETITLPAGIQLPGESSCEIVATVHADTAGTYVNTIPAGALQTDLGDSFADAVATLTVETPLNDPLASFSPTSFSFTVEEGQTDSATLNIANDAGRLPLTFSIAAHDEAAPRVSIGGSAARATAPRIKLDPASILRSRVPAGSNGGHAGASAPAPSAVNGDIDFEIDSGYMDNALVLTNDLDEQMAGVWINRFAVTEPLTIDTISIAWPENGGNLIGLDANLVVYYDAASTGDPTNAVRIGADTLVPISVESDPIGSLATFETYSTNFAVPGPGDVYIGFVDQWALGGGYAPFSFVAGMDETGVYAGDSFLSFDGANEATDIDVLGNNDTTLAIGDAGFPANWLIRATGQADGNGGGDACTGPVIGWLSAAPASGSINGGDDQDVTLTVDPDAAGLGAGSYTAELCITTNDPTQPLVALPVDLTVTAADMIFCNGFEEGEDGACNIAAGGDVVTGMINVSLVADGDGSTFDFATGQAGAYDPGRVDDINLYDFGDGMYVYWYGDMSAFDVGGVVDAMGEVAVLQSGETIGPASTFDAASIPMTNWVGGADGYLGIAFENEDTGELNYGYIHMTTSGPDGYPAQWLEYAYDKSGAAITIP